MCAAADTNRPGLRSRHTLAPMTTSDPLQTLFGNFFAAETLLWSRAGQRRLSSVRAIIADGARSPDQVVDLYGDLLHAVIALDQAIRAVAGRRRAVGRPPPAGIDLDSLRTRAREIRDAVIHEDDRILMELNIKFEGDVIDCRSTRKKSGVSRTARLSLDELGAGLDAIERWSRIESRPLP